MRSIPYKTVITSYSVYNNTQMLSLSIIKAKLEVNENEYKISNKGSLKMEFIPCIENPAFPGRKKLILEKKIEAYLFSENVFEILTKNATISEFKTFNQETVKFVVGNSGHEWQIEKNNKKAIVLLKPIEKTLIYELLEVIHT